MAKSNGTTRNSAPAPKAQEMTFEQQVDGALKGLRSEFFQRMEDFYEGQAAIFKEAFADWKKKEDYISAAGSSASEQNKRAEEVVAHGPQVSAISVHSKIERDLKDDYADLVSGGYYKEGAKAPSFYSLIRGEKNISEMDKAIRVTAERNAEKKFSEVRSKMLKTTVEKGIDLKNAKVQSVSGDGFMISDGKVALHARYILAWGEVKAPHFRFIITDRKNR